MFLWVENAKQLVKSCLLIFKALKIQESKKAAKFLANKASKQLMYHSY